ncbi:serine/threonine protein kinase [Serratia sp. Lou2A]|jgi:Ser/Thr protein kinase RdoA (MazF antagonist)|uniref:Stress response kinase A n=1 Tax=Serratia montpellierensis TaxID=2598730 RepID=A0ABS8J2A8_9GAMM|nr:MULTISPECIES: serine/threonine protein kinase [Serratia]MBH3201304.1 serine/threonine protein kinase [Serratia marcescens]MBI6125744.1 serine/threonine protein kinase [Serratia marcescens]MBL5823974.1 serine/threonine protein kinase [Serratia marcescens]MCC7583989.1 serine/threonine protein kinase [Serratia sp. Lou2A]MCC7658126.1 serine/threonine protein kinase [Serratia sp. Pon4B]
MNNSAFNFDTLSPDLIMDALEGVGLRVDSGLTALNSYENRVYQFMDEDRRRYVVKFYRPERWSAAQIGEEHQFALDLAKAEIPAVAPLALQGATLHTHGGFFFTLFPSVGGRQYEIDNLDQLEWVGRFLGRIHQVGGEHLFAERPTMGVEEYLTAPRQVLAGCELLPAAQRDAFLQATDKLIAAIKPHWHLNWQPRRLHGDCHPGNILWRDGPLFVDLDDARNGPAVQDLWMLLHGERRDQLMQLDVLLEAYGEFAEFDQRELALIEPLRAMRMVYYLAWVARRWQDPAFPKSFPWMAESDFWLSQTAAFTEQVKLLQEPPLQLTPMY